MAGCTHNQAGFLERLEFIQEKILVEHLGLSGVVSRPSPLRHIAQSGLFAERTLDTVPR